MARVGFEPRPFRSQFRRANHSTTLRTNIVQIQYKYTTIINIKMLIASVENKSNKLQFINSLKLTMRFVCVIIVITKQIKVFVIFQQIISKSSGNTALFQFYLHYV